MESPPEGGADNLSKKRAAFRQLTKDDGLDAEEETDSVIRTGTFKRASDEVLASRRIVKVRRTAPAPSSTNPFASISLVPPSAAPDQVISTADDVKNAIHEDIESQKNGKEDTFTQKNLSSPATDSVEAEAKGGVLESEGSEDTITGKLQSTPKVEDATRNGETEVSQPGENGESGAKDINGMEELSSGKGDGATDSALSFQQHSRDKNAFSFSFGTGFSKSSFSFGVSPSPFSSPVGFGSFGSSSSLGSVSFGSSLSTAYGPQIFGKSGNSAEAQDGSQDEPPKPAHFGQQFQAAVSLPEVTVETGEEKERTIFTADTTLFEFIHKGWKERGKGELKINLSEDAGGKARLVMRSRGNLRLLLNANLFPDMRLNRMDSKSITFACANSASTVNAGGLTTYAVKLKDSSLCDDFIVVVEAHKRSSSGRNIQKSSLGRPKENDESSKEETGDSAGPVEAADESDPTI